MSLCSDIIDASDPRLSKQDVVDYYKEKYPGSKVDSRGRSIAAWRSHATTAYAGATGLSRASAAREFQGQRAASSGRANKAIWEQIGEKLPPRPPDNGFRIYGTVWVKYSEECEERDIDETIAGKAAMQLIDYAMNCEEQEATLHQAIINQYQNDDIDVKGPNECNPPDLHVEPLD